jgi:6-phosphogluconate dehydrogenase
MKIGFIGLGRMGANMVRRLLRSGLSVVAWNRTYDKTRELIPDGVIPADSPENFLEKLDDPKIIWLMLPAGPVTDQMIDYLQPHLKRGDIIIDGGNTHYKSDIQRYKALKTSGIHYVDVGTSGGVKGLQRGYCLMIGGDAEPVQMLQPVFEALSPGQGDIAPIHLSEDNTATAHKGYLHCGPVGSGHFVKMIHNGIEYGLMQAYAEGLNILHTASEDNMGSVSDFDFKIPDILELWRRGSVIGSWLLDLTTAALADDPDLTLYEGVVGDSGEGRWTVDSAVELSVPIPVLSASLFTRFESRNRNIFADKVLSAMRYQFGGHKE